VKLPVLIAMVLAALNGVVCASAEESQPAAGKQVEQSFPTKDGTDVPYLLYLPSDYEQGRSEWPLMLFLHGRGESDGPLSLVAKWGPPMMAARGEQLPYIMVSPQCPTDDAWSKATQQSRVIEMIDAITTK
jgi:predicted peptidase